MSGEDIKDKVVDTLDVGVDLIEKVSSPASRSGSIVNRVAAMDKEGLDREVIALQMTKGSHHNQTYTERDIEAYVKLDKDAHSGVNLTARQTTALIRDQKRARTEKKPSETIKLGLNLSQDIKDG